MSINKYLPHLFLIPEDKANEDIVNGFLLDHGIKNVRQIQPLEIVGGWQAVVNEFSSIHVGEMRRFDQRVVILLIDFDNREDRLAEVKKAIPEDLYDRVFILGAKGEPEDLKRANLGSFEQIGKLLAKDCVEDVNATWSHDLLRHNEEELLRMRNVVRPILFLE